MKRVEENRLKAQSSAVSQVKPENRQVEEQALKRQAQAVHKTATSTVLPEGQSSKKQVYGDVVVSTTGFGCRTVIDDEGNIRVTTESGSKIRWTDETNQQHEANIDPSLLPAGTHRVGPTVFNKQ